MKTTSKPRSWIDFLNSLDIDEQKLARFMYPLLCQEQKELLRANADIAIRRFTAMTADPKDFTDAARYPDQDEAAQATKETVEIPLPRDWQCPSCQGNNNLFYGPYKLKKKIRMKMVLCGEPLSVTCRFCDNDHIVYLSGSLSVSTLSDESR